MTSTILHDCDHGMIVQHKDGKVHITVQESYLGGIYAAAAAIDDTLRLLLKQGRITDKELISLTKFNANRIHTITTESGIFT